MDFIKILAHIDNKIDLYERLEEKHPTETFIKENLAFLNKLFMAFESGIGLEGAYDDPIENEAMNENATP